MSKRVLVISEEFGLFKVESSAGFVGTGVTLTGALEAYNSATGAQIGFDINSLFADIPKKQDSHGPVST